MTNIDPYDDDVLATIFGIVPTPPNIYNRTNWREHEHDAYNHFVEDLNAVRHRPFYNGPLTGLAAAVHAAHEAHQAPLRDEEHDYLHAHRYDPDPQYRQWIEHTLEDFHAQHGCSYDE